MRHLKVLFALLAIVSMAAVAAGCGGDDGGGGGGESGAEANAADQAFVRLMVPHHESAVEMAEVAQEKSQRKEIKTLADAIVTTQNAEIEELNRIADSIGADSGGEAMEGMDHGGGSMDSEADLEALGLSSEEAGMSMSMDMTELEDAKPFDRAFIDMMVPHHEAAVTMAKAVLERGQNPEVKALAEKIITAQEKEIKQMNSWRSKWYGGPVPEDS